MAGIPEENRAGNPFWNWLLIVWLCIVIILWGLFTYWAIPDTPRKWDMGALPDAPSQSVYSSAANPAPAEAPRQIAPLPEAKPWKPVGDSSRKTQPQESKP
jgi:hypothetical protein